MDSRHGEGRTEGDAGLVDSFTCESRCAYAVRSCSRRGIQDRTLWEGQPA